MVMPRARTWVLLVIKAAVSLHFSSICHFSSSFYDEVVDTSKNIAEILEWFHGCRMNYAENLLKHQGGGKTAIITYGESDR